MKIAIILNAPKIDCEITEDNVIFADAGYKFRQKVEGKNVLLVVGDFDSLKALPKSEIIAELEVEKNFTDGEVAVLKAKEFGATEIVIYGAFGGRIDHVLGNIALLKIAKNLGLKAKLKGDAEEAFLIDGEGRFSAKVGSTISLFSYGEECEFAYTEGLYYPLCNLKLTNGDTRGISNVSVSSTVKYGILSGQALVIVNDVLSEEY